MGEIWKDCVRSSKYEISNTGKLRHKLRLRILKRYIGFHGYIVYNIFDNQKVISMPAHIAVAAAFIGPRPEGLCVNHKDGNKTNNSIDNLEYVTTAENAQHASRMGLLPKGVDHRLSKLNEEDVNRIRKFKKQGATTRGLARMFLVSETNIRYIIAGKTWRHI